jgi:hypothetical protein
MDQYLSLLQEKDGGMDTTGGDEWTSMKKRGAL